jgi:hypothetical protein
MMLCPDSEKSFALCFLLLDVHFIKILVLVYYFLWEFWASRGNFLQSVYDIFIGRASIEMVFHS